MPRLLAALACLVLIRCVAAADAAGLQRIGRDRLCVSAGAVSTLPDGRMTIERPTTRAVVCGATGTAAEIRFRYLGPSAASAPLASGELRRQIGLKLRAQDTCNVLYVMWHIEPDARISASIKRNPGMSTHSACGAGGYITLGPRTSLALPRILPGESHELRAELRGTDLRVVADGKIAWQGTTGEEVMEFDGPVGLRTDNARFELEFYAARPGW